MKRTITLLLTLALLLVLPGCGKDKVEGTDLDGDRGFIHMLRETCATEDAFYYGDGHLIYYVDRNTGINMPLCGKPECEHNDDTCNAYYKGALYNICSYDGRLYIIRSGVKVYSCDYDGTNRQEVMLLNHDLMPGSGLYGHFQLHRGYLYYSGVSETVKNGEAKYIYQICAFPLDSDGEGFVIFEGDAGSSFSTPVIQPYGDELYILLSTYDTSGGAQHGFSVKRWDTQAKELEDLYEADSVLFNYVVDMWVMDEGIMFQGFTDEEMETSVYKYDFHSSEVEKLFVAAPASTGIYAGVGIGDHAVVGHTNTDENGVFYILIKDFEGNVLVEDNYTLDLPTNRYILYFLGSDETGAYFQATGSLQDQDGNTYARYVSIIVVPLDGSGAYILSSTVKTYD